MDTAFDSLRQPARALPLARILALLIALLPLSGFARTCHPGPGLQPPPCHQQVPDQPPPTCEHCDPGSDAQCGCGEQGTAGGLALLPGTHAQAADWLSQVYPAWHPPVLRLPPHMAPFRPPKS